MVGRSTGSPHQHTGPPSSAGRKSTMVGPITGGPPKSTHWPSSSAGLKSSYWPLSSASRNQHGLAPLCRPKLNTTGPTLQTEINHCWPHSAGQNQLLVVPLCRPKIIYCYPNMTMAIQQYTPIGHQCQQYYPLPHSSDGLPSNPLSHPKMVSPNLSDHGSSYPGYRAISQYIHPPWCLQIVCPAPKLKIPDTSLIGGKC